MRAADLVNVADDLYALPPRRFREARDERAARAREAGDRELARAIGKLRRPTVTAWLVNQLVRAAGGEVDELLELGAQLREAQSELAGASMRELSARRRGLVADLTRSAGRLAREAGQSVGEQTERELATTLEAALADPAAADAVRSGRLTTALAYAGLGEVDLDAAVAVPDLTGRAPQASPGKPAAGREPAAGGKTAAGGKPAAGGTPPAGRKPRERKSGPQGAERQDREAARKAHAAEVARRDLAEAEAAARAAQEALAEAGQQADAAARRHDEARQRIDELEYELDEAQREQRRAARAAADARRGRDAAGRAATTAQRRLASARERAGRTG